MAETNYIKAKAYGSNTGYFSIAVTSTVFVETVSINKSYIALNKGKTADLDATVTPSYATNKTLRWETGDASVGNGEIRILIRRDAYDWRQSVYRYCIWL